MFVKNFLLVGNPNTGKSTFFSKLTGESVLTGNRPGVTVESKLSKIKKSTDLNLEDLPGIYYLDSDLEALSLDQQVTLERLNQINNNDIILNIVDCRYLRRNLFLTLQLLEQQLPLVIVLTFCTDKNLKEQLASYLKIPVYLDTELLQENSTSILKELSLIKNNFSALPHFLSNDLLKNHLQRLHSLSKRNLADGDLALSLFIPESFWDSLKESLNISDKETALATARYKYIDRLPFIDKTAAVIGKLTDSIDRFTMHRFLGLPIFIFVMYLTFWSTIVLGSIINPFIEAIIESIFSYISSFIKDPFGVNVLNGLSVGATTLASFISPLFILYFMLGLWEQTGYMQRASLVIDKLMQYLKLPGQSFVPIIVGFGCNVPAIMGSRTLNYERDRIQTILMSPFMSCSARLAIFTVFAHSFFGASGHKIIFGLYLFGFIIAILTGLIVRYSLGRQESSPLVQEMVPYHLPDFKSIFRSSKNRLFSFLKKAATVILPAVLAIQLIASTGASLSPSYQKTLIKIFKPIGLQESDWPAALSLLTGIVAKEVVIGSLEAFQHIQKPLLIEQPIVTNNFFNLLGKKLSIAWDDMLAVEKPTEPKLTHLFQNTHAAISYLIFVLLYFPCISVTTAIAKESRHYWATFAIVWTTSLAYICSLIYYQLATNFITLNLLGMIVASLLYLGLLIYILKRQIKQDSKRKLNFSIKIV